MDIRKHLSFIDPHSFDSKGRHSSIRDEEKPWFNPNKDSHRNHRSMIHNKSTDENSNDLSWIHHSKSLKSLEKDRSPLQQRTRGYQMRRSDIGKENIVNNVPRNAKKSAERVDTTDITNKYKSLFKSYEQLVRLNILNEEALKAEKKRCEEQKNYIGTLTAIIEESISKGGLLAYFKKSFSQVNMTEDIYEHLFNVVDLHKRLQTANDIEMKLRNEMEIIKKQTMEVLKRKERLNGEVSQFQKVNEELRSEVLEKEKAFEDLKKEKDEIHQEKRSLVEYIAILKDTLAPKSEYQSVQNEANLFKDKYEELRKEYNKLENENKELEDKNISTIKELEEKKILIKELEFGKEKLLLEWKEKEKEFNKKGKDDIIKDEEYENLRAKIQDLEKELEKERETRKHLEVALASRISEAAKQQSSIDRLIKERDESVALTDDLELKLKTMEEENSYLRMEIKVFEENKRTKDSSDEKIKIISGLFSNLEKEIQKIVELCHNGEESKEMEALKSQLKEIKHEQCMEDIGDSLERIIKMLKYVSKEIIKLNEKHTVTQQQIEKDTTKYKELEAKKNELIQRLEVSEANALKLNKQNQKLFKEKQIIATELDQREEELKEVKLKIGLLEKEKESKNHSTISQTIIDYLKCFIFNTEVMETIEMLSKNLEEIRLIENNTALNNESMRTPDKSQPRESFRNIQGKQEELLKKNNELEKDLYDLQIAEETRYHSLYQLEKQNAHLRDELNEFISTFGNNEERGFQSSEKKSPRSEAKRERDRPNMSKLFADYRMPMTQINFDTEE